MNHVCMGVRGVLDDAIGVLFVAVRR
jgi:hypothetical protein